MWKQIINFPRQKSSQPERCDYTVGLALMLMVYYVGRYLSYLVKIGLFRQLSEIPQTADLSLSLSQLLHQRGFLFAFSPCYNKEEVETEPIIQITQWGGFENSERPTLGDDLLGERPNSNTVLSNKITRNRTVQSFKDSPRKPLGQRPVTLLSVLPSFRSRHSMFDCPPLSIPKGVRTEAFTSLSFTLRPLHIHSSVFQEALASCSYYTPPGGAAVSWKKRERGESERVTTKQRKERETSCSTVCKIHCLPDVLSAVYAIFSQFLKDPRC